MTCHVECKLEYGALAIAYAVLRVLDHAVTRHGLSGMPKVVRIAYAFTTAGGFACIHYNDHGGKLVTDVEKEHLCTRVDDQSMLYRLSGKPWHEKDVAVLSAQNVISVYS